MPVTSNKERTVKELKSVLRKHNNEHRVKLSGTKKVLLQRVTHLEKKKAELRQGVKTAVESSKKKKPPTPKKKPPTPKKKSKNPFGDPKNKLNAKGAGEGFARARKMWQMNQSPTSRKLWGEALSLSEQYKKRFPLGEEYHQGA
jgi:hypothetical protein